MEHAESQSVDGRGFVNEMLLQVKSDVTTHANEHGSGDTVVAQVPRCQGCATFTVRSKRCHELAVDFCVSSQQSAGDHWLP